MQTKVLIAPSLLSANFLKLAEEIENVEKAGADILHCDIMDGHFVPNLTFGPFILSQMKKKTKTPLDVHLMIEEPERWVDAYADAGSDWLTIHFEASKDLKKTLEHMKSRKVKVGLSLKPHTPMEKILPFVELCDHILVMTVEPGFGGQKFMESCLEKIKKLQKHIHDQKLPTLIEVDGGVTRTTIQSCFRAGARVFVAGTEIFKAPSYSERIQELREAAKL